MLSSASSVEQLPGARLLGHLLVERQIVSASDIQKALAFQEQFGGRIGSILVRLGALSEETLLPVLADQLGMPVLSGDEWPQGPDSIRTLFEKSAFAADWWLDYQQLRRSNAVDRLHCCVDCRDPRSQAHQRLARPCHGPQSSRFAVSVIRFGDTGKTAYGEWFLSRTILCAYDVWHAIHSTNHRWH